MNIAILGAGVFGKALGKILTDNGHKISYYDPNVYPEITLDMATYKANTIIIAIPSIFFLVFIDSYHVLDKNGTEPMDVQLHFLEPIPYEEYKPLKTPELAAMVKERIQKVIDANT